MSASTRPEPSPTREYQFPKFERRLLKNGLTVLVAPTHSLPIVTVLAIVDAGAVAEPAEQEGVAELTAHALNEGTPKYDGEALTDYLEQLGTSVGGAANWDSASLAMTVLRDNLENAFVHFAEVLTTPTFPIAAIERLKAERIAELMQIESEPRELADEKFDEYIYAATSRFRAPLGGTAESVRKLTRSKVVTFHADRYQPSATTLIIVGDVDVGAVARIVASTLEGWSGAIVPGVRAVDKPDRVTRAVRIVGLDQPARVVGQFHRPHPHLAATRFDRCLGRIDVGDPQGKIPVGLCILFGRVHHGPDHAAVMVDEGIVAHLTHRHGAAMFPAK